MFVMATSARAATLCPAPGTGETALSAAANAMLPGQWCELNTTNFNGGRSTKGDILKSFSGETISIQGGPSTNCGCSSNGSIFEYADGAAWNPVARALMFIGTPHPGCPKFVKYDEQTNSWSTLPLPPESMVGDYDVCSSGQGPGNLISHAYDHNAVDPVTGDFYHHFYNTARFIRFSQSSQTWNELPQMCSGCGYQITGVVDFFTERNSLFYLNSGFNNVYRWDKATNTWSEFCDVDGGANNMFGGYQTVGTYNSKQKFWVFGGGNGSSKLFKIAESGSSCTQIPDAPFAAQVADGYASNGALFVADPASGDLLLYRSTGSFYKFSATTGTWSDISSNAPPAPFAGSSFSASQAVVAAVPERGVTLWVKWAGANSAILVYKHSVTQGGTTPPPTPGALRVQ